MVASLAFAQLLNRSYSFLYDSNFSLNGSLVDSDVFVFFEPPSFDVGFAICFCNFAISSYVRFHSFEFGFNPSNASCFLAMACLIAPTVPSAYVLIDSMPPLRKWYAAFL